MDLLPNLVNAFALAVVGAFVWFITRGQTQQLSRRIERLENRMDSRFESLESRLDNRFERVESEVGSLRSDLTQIALAVGAPPRRQTR